MSVWLRRRAAGYAGLQNLNTISPTMASEFMIAMTLCAFLPEVKKPQPASPRIAK
jgi:hypothetical protein